MLVVSAMGKETDHLLRLASEVSQTRPAREMDMLITAGERKAIALMCMALHDMGVPADSFTGSQAGFFNGYKSPECKNINNRSSTSSRSCRRRTSCCCRRIPRRLD
ncbi:MAG: hypothetical protein CM15mP49_36290 [Actinomycetota bacterium]|nr:MAG: hypothetical protein CM15mP49_36290 [Actinomycetota bacterium]